MFTTTNLAAGIAVVALSATALIALTLPNGVSQVPAGATLPGASEASTFTGTRHSDPDEVLPAMSSSSDGVVSNRGEAQTSITVESTDPRFRGSMDFSFNSDLYFEQGTGSFWGDQLITNDEGAWSGPLVGAGNPMGHWRAQGLFVGEGGYEGLVAIVYCDSDNTFEGAIVPGPLPSRE